MHDLAVSHSPRLTLGFVGGVPLCEVINFAIFPVNCVLEAAVHYTVGTLFRFTTSPLYQCPNLWISKVSVFSRYEVLNKWLEHLTL